MFSLGCRADGSRTPDPQVERASFVVGYSTGTGFRDVLPVTPSDFRQGLLDGLGGEATQARVMTRPELFTRIRGVTRRLAEAELAALAAQIDQAQDF